jgi:hypothetical protein
VAGGEAAVVWRLALATAVGVAVFTLRAVYVFC